MNKLNLGYKQLNAYADYVIVQENISQQVWENWTRDWEIEARAASGVAASGS